MVWKSFGIIVYETLICLHLMYLKVHPEQNGRFFKKILKKYAFEKVFIDRIITDYYI